MRAIQERIYDELNSLRATWGLRSYNKNIFLIGNTGLGKTLPVICHIKDHYVTHEVGLMYLIAVPSLALRRQWAEQLVQQGQYPFINVREGSFTQDDIVQVNTYEVIFESLLPPAQKHPSPPGRRPNPDHPGGVQVPRDQRDAPPDREIPGPRGVPLYGQ
jgi:superfamily II DNA or RNA helicase